MFFNLQSFKPKSLIPVFVLTTMLILAVIPVNAQDSGKNPLVLEGFRLVDKFADNGERAIVIEFIFSKNVVNMVVLENNKQCFKVIDKDDGDELPLEIQMADDQVEREKRNSINLIIKSGIESLKTYQIIISPELESKSGEKLGEKLILEFAALGIVK
ncbi:MAG: hypothetical protein GX240_02635 [Candidatus Atribacteria bacterium]|nr:hypothetical protein [Candidatus Atribacteria bacterium]